MNVIAITPHLYFINNVKKFLPLILLTIFLTSCIALPQCIDKSKAQNPAFSFKDYVLAQLLANNKEWTDSSVYLNFNQIFEVKISGEIEQCLIDKILRVDAKKEDITQSGIIFNANELITIELAGGNTLNNMWSKSKPNFQEICQPKKQYAGCMYSKGMGLLIYNNKSLMINLNNRFLPHPRDYITDKNFKLDENTKIHGVSIAKSLNAESLTFKTTSSGSLGFKLSDCSGCYIDNYGGYNVRVIKGNQTCQSKNGISNNNNYGKVEYFISENRPKTTDKGTDITFSFQQIQAERSGKLWFRIHNQKDKYKDSSGFYQINIKTISIKSGKIGSFLNNVVTRIKDKVRFTSRIIYHNFGENSHFHTIIQSMLVLYIIFFGIYYLSGLTKISQQDLVIRIAKIGTVIMLLSPQSWEFFNGYFLNIFTNGMEELIYKVTGTSPNTKSGVFSFVDFVLNQFFSSHVWLKISSFMFYLVGIIYVILFLYALFVYLFVIIEAYIGYLIVIVAISFLISLAPMFIPLLLFTRTAQYFKNWLKYITNFMLQPVFLFLAIALMNELIMHAFWKFLNFKACWGCAIPIWLDLNYLMSFFNLPIPDMKIKLFCFSWFRVALRYIAEIFPSLLIFVIFVTLLRSMVTFAPRILDYMTGVMPGSGISTTGEGSFAHNVSQQASETIKGLVGQDQGSKSRRKYNDGKGQEAADIKDEFDEYTNQDRNDGVDRKHR